MVGSRMRTHMLWWLSAVLTTWTAGTAAQTTEGSSSRGEWGAWGEPGECSRPCGVGVHHRRRHCLTVGPDDIPNCSGHDRIYISCNTQACPPGSPDPRADQCAQYNSIQYEHITEGGDGYFQWVPYYASPRDCTLNCLAEGQSFYLEMAAQVRDGTPCGRDTRDVCVQGRCEAVGCDGALGSDVVEDRCGECGGQNNTCSVHAGTLTTHHLKEGYNDVLLIPAGATNIDIQEASHSHNYIALRSAAGEWIVNEDWQIGSSRTYTAAGAAWRYTRDGHQEALQADGPTDTTVYLMIIKQTGHGALFHYVYSVPEAVRPPPAPSSHNWLPGNWTACTRSCAGGSQTRSITCITQESEEEVSSKLCDQTQRPAADQPCNTEPCPAEWAASEWSECSTTCGHGHQVRVASCQQQHAGVVAVVDQELCNHDNTPPTWRQCNKHTPCPTWKTSPWSKCNRPCGEGIQTRRVFCQAQHHIQNSLTDILPGARCDLDARPQDKEDCDLGPCQGVEWIVSEWSGCRGSCLAGVETRQVVCGTEAGLVQDEGLCGGEDLKPATQRACSRDEEECQPAAKWHASQWGQCSSRCGRGVQHRSVVCAINEGATLELLNDDDCDSDARMAEKQECNGTECHGIWFYGPFGKCSVECGGGQRRRDTWCFDHVRPVSADMCDPSLQPDLNEDCNRQPCDDDDLIMMGGCKETQFGCCPDGITPADGQSYAGCPSRDPVPRGACIEEEFGCCLDGNTPAGGPFRKGCPDYTCLDTEYGCCEDNETPAGGRDYEGCPVVLDCQETLYGCCEDGFSTANGLDKLGCDTVPHADCERSPFGCCPDTDKPALGPDGGGCGEVKEDTDDSSGEVPSERCLNSLFGCCPDGISIPTGPGQQGCTGIIVGGCAGTRFGCCEDGESPATGLELDGCEDKSDKDKKGKVDCKNTIFGCCWDDKTVARGPNNLGCTPPMVGGCESTRHGCCPDSEFAAHGPDFLGCPGVEPERSCSDSRHGCCPDGESAAAGPGFVGCDLPRQDSGCDQTVYGCCQDGRSMAVGPEFEGCPGEDGFVDHCRYSYFGCCPDGESESLGPNNAGCPSVTQQGENCAMDSDRGPCSNYTVKWFFEPLYGDCKRFWYGGCDGNRNRFESKAECRGKCVKVEGLAKCYLPKSVGRCSALEDAYHYNPDKQACELFGYGGCNGNANRFRTMEPCVTDCVRPHKPDVCSQPMQSGPCRGEFPRWRYDSAVKACVQFSYGGCRGNDNMFDLQADCEMRCMKPKGKVCLLERDAGPCKAEFPRWFFNTQSEECEQFNYGGCHGNGNRFGSEDECRQTCKDLLKTKDIDVCQLPQDVGPCKAYFERWYHDLQDGLCKQFVYGGCDGNGNRFESELHCRQSCNATAPVDTCTLPMETGPCKASILRYHFDKSHGECRQFVFGGCKGNANNFETVEECEKSCSTRLHVTERPGTHTHRCNQRVDPGPCLGDLARFHYDPSTQNCSGFVYGGCEGNRNRFLTHTACLEACTPTDPATPHPDPTTPHPDPTNTHPDPTTAHPDPTTPRPHHPHTSAQRLSSTRHPHTTTPRPHHTTAQRPTSEKSKIEIVTPTPTPSPHAVTEAETADVCRHHYSTGPCTTYQVLWYYNHGEKRCNRFHYSGCGGNNNRFESREACERRCLPTDICSQRQDSGECTGYIPSWYYDKGMDRCLQFVYGGCGGNSNRFQTNQECEAKCQMNPSNVTGLDVCALQSEVGPCKAAHSRYYYDYETGECTLFQYGGCRGNENNFPSLDQCQQACPLNDICMLSSQVGPCRAAKPRFYFDTPTATCQQFTYGGCGGNANRFLTIQNCEHVCGPQTQPGTAPPPTSPAPHRDSSDHPDRAGSAATPKDRSGDVCQMKKDSGPCTGYFPVWYFEPTTRSCRRFLYGGCQGNGNRFNSRGECEAECLHKPKEGATTAGAPVTTTTAAAAGGDASTKVAVNPTEAVEFDLCLLESDNGMFCLGWELRWHFDASVARCRQFYYGGCDGNANRFMSEEDCSKTCVDRRVKAEEFHLCMLEPWLPTVHTDCFTLDFNTELHVKLPDSDLRPPKPLPAPQALQYPIFPELQPMPLLPEQMSPESKAVNLKRTQIRSQGFHPELFVPVLERPERPEDLFIVDGAEKARPDVDVHPLVTLSETPDRKIPLLVPLLPDPMEQRPDLESSTKNTDKAAPRLEPIHLEILPIHSPPLRQLSEDDQLHRRRRDVESILSEVGGGSESDLDVRQEDSERRPLRRKPKKDKKDRSYYANSFPVEYVAKDPSDTVIDVVNVTAPRGDVGTKNTSLANGIRLESSDKFAGNLTQTELSAIKNITSLQMSNVSHTELSVNRSTVVHATTKMNSTKAGNAPGVGTRTEGKSSNITQTGNTTRSNVTREISDINTPPPTTGNMSVKGSIIEAGRSEVTPIFINSTTINWTDFKGGKSKIIMTNATIKANSTMVNAKVVEFSTTNRTVNNSTTAHVVKVANTSMSDTIKSSITLPNFNKSSTSLTNLTKSTKSPAEDKHTLVPKTSTRGQPAKQMLPTRWHYNATEGKCVAMTSPHLCLVRTANNFATHQECMRSCGPQKLKPLPEPSKPQHAKAMCFLAPSQGTCGAELFHWYYDHVAGVCKDFIYGGCGGNPNNFVSKKKCQISCQRKVKDTDVCAMRQDVGPCQAYQLRFYFDPEAGQCRQFEWGGCQGNLNNFKSQKECEEMCTALKPTHAPATDADVCRKPKESGPCFSEFLRYHYDEYTQECRPFIYGGCQGNGNNFETQEQCYKLCSTEPKKQRFYIYGDCYNMADPGPCQQLQVRYHFDPAVGDCRAFYYGGCDGNGNNFHSYDDCLAYCSQVTEVCGVLACNLECPHGYSRAADGCQECSCEDPCDTHTCASDEECVLEEVVCVRSPCPAQPICRKKPKIGKCPAYDEEDLNTAMCVTECEKDDDCIGQAKCCYNGCGHICIFPNVPDCTNTVYGCCPDGFTVATGWNYHGCPEEVPVIEDHRRDIIAIEGSTAIIPCKTAGAPLPQITWYKSRFPIAEQSDEDLRLRVRVDGSLQISDVDPSDGTTYTCRAYNTVGATTRTYTLLVQVPVTFMETPTNYTVYPEDKVEMECVANGNPMPQIRWIRNGQMVALDDVNYIQDPDGTLTITAVRTEDEGEYTCEASNTIGDPSIRTVHINVKGPFQVHISSTNTSLAVGEDLRLVCHAEGDLEDVVTAWNKNGHELQTDSRVKMPDNGELLIEDLVVDDGGRYECTALRENTLVSSYMDIEVTGVSMPVNCTDTPFYANCKLIMEARLCRHQYFKVFCCKSCHEGGHLP